jgi:hypothetical protein
MGTGENLIGLAGGLAAVGIGLGVMKKATEGSKRKYRRKKSKKKSKSKQRLNR